MTRLSTTVEFAEPLIDLHPGRYAGMRWVGVPMFMEPVHDEPGETLDHSLYPTRFFFVDAETKSVCPCLSCIEGWINSGLAVSLR